MTDEHETPLTPAQEDEVRRLLGGARHDQPMPPEIVARMDSVLEGLADEPDRRAPVVDLAKRRRRAATFLVAAAAVVVVGIGIGQVVDTGNGFDGESESAGDGGGTAADSDTFQAEEPAPAEAAPRDRAEEDSAGNNLAVEPRDLYTVDPDELSADVDQLRKSEPYRFQVGNWSAAARDFKIGAATCRTVDWGAGVLIPIQYGADRGGLVFREPLGDTQVADVYLCGDRSPVRSLTLPVP